jgi:dTDP-4-dehydrorhamnose reductase
MKVIVLGANGQLGSDLVRFHAAHPRSVELIPLTRKDLDVTELRSIAKVLAQIEFDALINCTSYHRIDEVEQNAVTAVLINSHAVQALAKASRERGARFIHISTDYVFGGEGTRAYIETDAPRPLNVYGASKFLGENLVLQEYAENSLILRVASLFGIAGASGKGGNFVETMLRLGREKGKVRVVNDITMSPTGTADVARIIMAFIEQGARPDIYHVVNSGQATWFEFAREIIRQAGVAAEVEAITSNEYPSVALRPVFSVLDNRKTATIAGPIPCWEDALTRYLRDKGHT